MVGERQFELVMEWDLVKQIGAYFQNITYCRLDPWADPRFINKCDRSHDQNALLFLRGTWCQYTKRQIELKGFK